MFILNLFTLSNMSRNVKYFCKSTTSSIIKFVGRYLKKNQFYVLVKVLWFV